jgi:hypothetical protein
MGFSPTWGTAVTTHVDVVNGRTDFGHTWWLINRTSVTWLTATGTGIDVRNKTRMVNNKNKERGQWFLLS